MLHYVVRSGDANGAQQFTSSWRCYKHAYNHACLAAALTRKEKHALVNDHIIENEDGDVCVEICQCDCEDDMHDDCY